MLNDTLTAGDQAAVDYCTQQTDIDIEFVLGPAAANDRLTLYREFFNAQSPLIDLMQIDVTWPRLLAPHLLDLSEAVDQSPFVAGGRSAYSERIVADSTVGDTPLGNDTSSNDTRGDNPGGDNVTHGELVGIPWFTDAGLLYYRSDLLSKYGFDAPPNSWAELERMARTIQAGER